MKQQRLLPLVLFLLSSSGAWSAAYAESLTPEVQIDRSVLQDLKGYEPPPMFGGATQSRPVKATPLKRVPVEPPAEAKLTVPKADELLNFPVQNDSVVTRQRMTAPEEHVASARPDYSDSHTVLDMTPAAGAPDMEPAPKKKAATKKASAKPPIPPKKPSIQLAAVSTQEVAKVASSHQQAKKTGPEKIIEKESNKPEQKAEISAAPMKPAAPKPKYVPSARPTMPAVPSEAVESAKLDAFALPLNEADKELIIEKPTPGERMMDQALTRNMTQVDKKDIESVMDGGKVTSGRKDEPLNVAALPVPATSTASKIGLISMEFKPEMTELKKDQQDALQSEILNRLKKNPDERLQIQAYSGEKSSASDARRISLSRALSIRAYLLDKGIDPSRMDVRAMGNNTTEQPMDRVDLIFLGRS